MKSINNFVDKLITRLGKSNDSEIVTALLAAFKLVFIPVATMSDKKSSKKQKEYAIKRDFLTETTALLGYIGITKAVKNNLTAPVCAKYYKSHADKFVKEGKLKKDSLEYNILSNVDKKALKNNAMSDLSDKFLKEYTSDQKEHIDKLTTTLKTLPSQLADPKELYLNTKKTISHLCVCTLALSLIPYTTNKILGVVNRPKKKDVPTYRVPDIKTYSALTKGGLNVFNR